MWTVDNSQGFIVPKIKPPTHNRSQSQEEHKGFHYAPEIHPPSFACLRNPHPLRLSLSTL